MQPLHNLLLTPTTARGWADTCYVGSLNLWELSTQCLNRAGDYWHTTSIDLDLCIANYGGALSCASRGFFYQSCQDCFLDGSILSCSCHVNDNTLEFTWIDTRECIDNINGNLECFGIYGS